MALWTVKRCRCLLAGQLWGRQQGCQHQACAADQGSTKNWTSYSTMFCVSTASPSLLYSPSLAIMRAFPRCMLPVPAPWHQALLRLSPPSLCPPVINVFITQEVMFKVTSGGRIDRCC